jgi:hypothetical protein
MLTPVAPSNSNINGRLRCRRHLKAAQKRTSAERTAGSAFIPNPTSCGRPLCAKSCRSDIAEQFEVLPEARKRPANDLGIAA